MASESVMITKCYLFLRRFVSRSRAKGRTLQQAVQIDQFRGPLTIMFCFRIFKSVKRKIRFSPWQDSFFSYRKIWTSWMESTKRMINARKDKNFTFLEERSPIVRESPGSPSGTGKRCSIVLVVQAYKWWFIRSVIKN